MLDVDVAYFALLVQHVDAVEAVAPRQVDGGEVAVYRFRVVPLGLHYARRVVFQEVFPQLRVVHSGRAQRYCVEFFRLLHVAEVAVRRDYVYQEGVPHVVVGGVFRHFVAFQQVEQVRLVVAQRLVNVGYVADAGHVGAVVLVGLGGLHTFYIICKGERIRSRVVVFVGQGFRPFGLRALH